MRSNILLATIVSILFFSCDNSDIDKLNINIKLEYDGAPLVFFEDVSYPDGRIFEFTRFSIYISEISLDNETNSTLIKDVDYLDLTASHSSLTSASEGFNYGLELSESMSFQKIRFNLGLTDEQNNSKPEDYNSSSPLALSGEYWSNWESYVFTKIEGRIDLDGDGISDGVALHLGSSEALRNLIFENLDSSGDIELTIDMKKVFERDGIIYDINATPRIHSLNQLMQTNILMDNLKAAIALTGN